MSSVDPVSGGCNDNSLFLGGLQVLTEYDTSFREQGQLVKLVVFCTCVLVRVCVCMCVPSGVVWVHKILFWTQNA